MPDIPKFGNLPQFPISSVIDAAQRNAQLQQQTREAGNKSLIEGLQSIGQIGQTLYDTKKRVAQSLALGRQFDIPDDVAKSMDPSQILQIGAIKKGNVDMSMLLSMLHPGAGGTNAPPAGATPASQTTPAAAPATPGPILASNVTATPISEQTVQPSLTPGATTSVPVPIQAPPIRPTVNKATFDAAMKIAKENKLEPVMTQADALASGGVKPGTHIINPAQGTADKKEQDRYFTEAVHGLQSIRGDQQVKDTENQRNAAIAAYNRLKQIKIEGHAPNPVDYADIVGQVYKARTGQAPTETILKKALQETATGKWGEAMTFLTGQQRPGTSQNIADSLMEMVAHMGLQADDLHEGMMQTHGAMVFNPNMSEENVKRLSKVARGKTFSEATGVKPEDFDPHVKAIQWAQANPNDPRSAPILQKAMQAKQSAGGNIGL